MSQHKTDEFSKGAEHRRRERDHYVDNPSYIHPVYGTPLKEPYKPSKKPVVVKVDGKPVKLPHEK